MMTIKSLFILVFISFQSIYASEFEHFITRDGHQLKDGNAEFRFAGFNAPELHRIEDDSKGVCKADRRGWGQHFKWPTSDEQENWIKALVGSGHKATRIYVLSVEHPDDIACNRETHILKPLIFGGMPILNEKAMVAYDQMIAHASTYKLRLILPFIDHWQWWGGREQLAEFYNENEDDFYNVNSKTFKAYLDIIRQVITRKNTITGRYYYQEKAIMAWETGNELKASTSTFVKKTAALIKKLAPEQLVIDGNYLSILEHSLHDDNIDIINNHFYTVNNNNNSQTIINDLTRIAGRKVYLVGEYGLKPHQGMSEIMQTAVHHEVNGAKAAGVFIWGFRGHRHNGGFYWHKEGSSPYYSYHLPGFIDGTANEELEVVDANGYVTYKATVRCPDCETNPDSDTIDPTGQGCLFAVEESTYYVHGRFVPSPQQMILLDKYETRPSYKVGFDIVQSIVTSQDDQSLNDNSLGTPNQTAPGADRYRIKLVLSQKPLADDDDENFVMLAKVEVGVLQEVKDKPQYAEIMDTLARRTYDESGDYTVNPFTINFKEHLASAAGANDGFKSAAEGGDEAKLVTMVSPGKAYVRGREIELIAEKIVPMDKARDTEGKRSTVIRPLIGNYLKVKLDTVSNIIPMTNVPNTETSNDFKKVNLYDEPSSGGNSAGNQIGTCRVKAMEMISGFVGGTGADEPVYALYIFDLNLGVGKTILDVEGLHKAGGGDQTFSASIEQDGGETKVYEPINNNLLYRIPFDFTKSIRDVDNPLISDTSITVIKKLVGSVNSSGHVVFVAEGNETYLNFDPNKWIGGLQQGAGQNYDPYDLTATDVMTVTPGQIQINVGLPDTGKDFVLMAEVLLSGVKEKTKVINTKFLNAIAGDQTTINLQEVDVFRVKNIIDVTSGNPATYVNVTDNYILDQNIKDNYYDLSSLKLKPGITTPDPGTLLNIEVDHFEHIGNGNFFSVDSYTAIINDPNEDFTYEDIPVYRTKDGEEFRMSDTIDFRPTVGDDGLFSGANAILNDLPVDESNIIFDVEYYLPRVDTLCVTEFGEFRMVKGIPAASPVPPSPAENSMPIYTVFLDAYTFDVKRNVKMAYIDNKRYTMKDIGRLDKRISNLEYYVTFNLLEKETSELSVLDANGNDRFKNGFLVDNFKDYLACQTSSSEFACALDTDTGELRPSFYTRNIELNLDEGLSANYVKNSDMTTLPYTEKVYQEQPYASKTISVNPYFIFEVEGIMQLTPNMDVWKDVETEPDLVVDIDTGVDALRDVANQAGVLGTQWNNWQTTSVSSTSQVSRQNSTFWTGRSWASRRWGGRSLTRRTTTNTTTVTNQERTGVNRQIEENIQRSSLGESVTSVNIIPYIRSIDVQFAASNMKPRTKVYAFFDDVAVTEDCRMLNSDRGSDLVTDATGSIVGSFRIPNRPDKRFFTGTRIFRLTNHETNGKDPDELTTSAEAQFFAGGMQETRRETVLSVRSPQLIETETRQQRSNTTFNTTVDTTVNRSTRTWLWRRSGDDPLAQSFTISEQSGVFLTGIELYFSNKSKDVPVWFQIRNMTNGYPSSVIVPYSEVTMQPGDIEVSESGNVPTMFKFEAPVYLQADEEYCFVVGSSSEEYRIHVSKLGGEDKLTGVTISTQPHLGSLFKSQNDSTWTAEQFEDIKFRIHRAEFDTSKRMKLTFKNGDASQRSELMANPFETESGLNKIRVYHKNHGLVAADKVKIEVLGDTWIEVHLASGNLVVGQEITGASNSGKATISDLEYVGIDGGTNNKIYRLKLANLEGHWAAGENFTGTLYYEQFRNPEMLKTLGIVPANLTHNIPTGNIPGGIDNDYNGIPLSEVSSTEHLVQHVDSIDSYVIQVTTNATATGRIGGSGNYAVGNVQMDVFNLQCNFIDYTGDALWKYSGVKHGGVGSTVTNYAAVGPFSFEPNENIELVEPMKVANKANEEMFLGVGNKSLTVTAEFGTEDAFVSPVLNLDSLAFTAVANRIDYNTCENYSVAPNAGTWAVTCDEDGSTARWKGEEQSSGGSEGAKYIMKPVTLKNPATNIKVYIDVLNYLDTDVVVYYRTLPAELEDDIVNMTWVKAPFDQAVVSEHDQDFREGEVSIPGVGAEVLPEFKSFQIKLVLKAKNSAKPPKAKAFRAIAVT